MYIETKNTSSTKFLKTEIFIDRNKIKIYYILYNDKIKIYYILYNDFPSPSYCFIIQ